MNQKQVYIILSSVIVVLLVIIGVMAIKQPEKEYEGSNVMVPANNQESMEKDTTGKNPEPITKTAESEVADTEVDWKEYTNTRYGFSMMVPASASSEVYINGNNAQIAFTSAMGNFEVDIRETYTGLGTAEQKKQVPFKDYHYFDMPRDGEGKLGGQTAAIFKAPKGYCDGPGCSVPYIAYSTDRPVALYYNLVFRGDAELNATEKKILESFKFKYSD